MEEIFVTITKSIQSWLRKTNIRPKKWAYTLPKFWKTCCWKENMSAQSAFLPMSVFTWTQTEEESRVTPRYQSKRNRMLLPTHGLFVIRVILLKRPTPCRKPSKWPTRELTMNAQTPIDELQPDEENDWKECHADIATTVKEAIPN
jgi:hypothetical protein